MFNRKPCSEETKRKIGLANSISLKGKKLSTLTKQKISDKLKGKKQYEMTDEIREKMSKSKLGHIPWNKGKICPEISKRLTGKHPSKETRGRMSNARIGRFGKEKCHFWKGGKSFEEYTLDWTDDLKESIRKRDNFICRLCGIHQDELEGFYKKLDIHHITYIKNNLDPMNLITLCRSCHVKTNHNREYWIEYFKGLDSFKKGDLRLGVIKKV